MATINPYLNFNGNTEEAFNFYKSVLGGEFLMLQRFKEIPGNDAIPAEVGEKIMHISLPIGNNILMATDALESMGHPLTQGNNFSVSINVDSEQEADQLYKGLSEGGIETLPLRKEFWGDYFGMLTDKFGIQWMISYSYNQPS